MHRSQKKRAWIDETNDIVHSFKKIEGRNGRKPSKSNQNN